MQNLHWNIFQFGNMRSRARETSYSIPVLPYYKSKEAVLFFHGSWSVLSFHRAKALLLSPCHQCCSQRTKCPEELYESSSCNLSEELGCRYLDPLRTSAFSFLGISLDNTVTVQCTHALPWEVCQEYCWTYWETQENNTDCKAKFLPVTDLIWKFWMFTFL